MWSVGRLLIWFPAARAEPNMQSSTYPTYDQSEARLHAQYARVSFCTQAAVENWTCGDMCEDTVVVPGSVRFLGKTKVWELQGYAARLPRGEDCIVAFRGSIDVMNWVDDMYAKQRPWPSNSTSWCNGCRVHSGFADAYEEIRPAMLEAINDLRCSSVQFAGHSLGAALVTLASMDLRGTTSLSIGPVWTFGKPRVGNYAFVNAYVATAQKRDVQPPLWRVVHYHDPVPRLAPAHSLGLDYDHEPLEVYYTDRASSKFWECPSNQQLPQPWENQSCAFATSLAGCVNMDHVTYLNLTFAFSNFPSSCRKGDHEHLLIV
eukprot:gnl/MRDRNA2_/MRDRNA2_118430_c0_seq1.p1 gnl/MRDRNA2_/MRDRNA2_118430_c0~~gnl/MRDRNA2_/MRDRNA2_118430_c0_seq1.p1  ORF type:complete len:318 (+),score=33.16 gnl/MRDRNA2_/MRDRNA2_118430_c0_seq1:172-1125(+)